MSEYLGSVVDLFSGAGGMSYGFFAHPSFEVVGAADLEIGKPSTGAGAIGCNETYEANIKVRPANVDLGVVDTTTLRKDILGEDGQSPTVLIACPPCTGFSRAVAKNWVTDDPRNSLVTRVAEFAAEFEPQIVVMENVPQLIRGSFRHHFEILRERLNKLGYDVHASVHMLNEFGLPQKRERALIIAVRRPLTMRTLEDLWTGYAIDPAAATVRRALSHLPAVATGETHRDDVNHTSTLFKGDSLERIKNVPKDGGSWIDLLRSKKTQQFLIPSMLRAVEKGRLNAYCDIYGRMYWDRPAPTIKRECSHVGNGRYVHPSQDRMCTVREMGILQGFPEDYKFSGKSRKNLYRHIGDAVPPLISYQLAWVCQWILTGKRPDITDAVLSGTSLQAGDIKPNKIHIQGTLEFC
ncbi:DNA cytosine methyltransferase [Amycolatopsis magusensis]|uniref:DNA cytosine methyltransferase n=1 Tax=Amycolatopsis magusensis TaxID=882444 RepID=UPI003C2B7867